MTTFRVEVSALAAAARTVTAESKNAELAATLATPASGSPAVDAALELLSQRWQTQTVMLCEVTATLGTSLDVAATNYLVPRQPTLAL